MKAKKLMYVSAALALTALGAQAQSTPGSGLTYSNGSSAVTVYGLIDVTLVNKNNVNTAGQSLTAPQVAWFSGNRWGITGSYGEGGPDDIKTIFRLEGEFESETGSFDTNNVIFNRDSWVGLQSKSLGKLTIGRQNALGRDPAGSASYGDPYGGAKASTEEGGYTNNNNFKQLIFYAGSANGTRVNNGVVWKKEWDSGFVSGLMYSFGTVPDSFNTGSSTTASLAYNGSGYTVAGFATSANINNFGHKTISFGGNMQLNSLVRVNAGYFYYTAQQAGVLGDRQDNAWTLSTKLTPEGKFHYEVGYQVMRASNAGVNGSGFVQNAYSDTSALTATGTGSRNTLYGSIFYNLNRQTELYVAFDRLNTTDTYLAAQANGATSANEYGVGMRFKF